MPSRYKKRIVPMNGFVTIVLPAFCLLNAINANAAEYEYLIEATALVEQIENPRRVNDSDDEEFLSQQSLRGVLTRATSKLVTDIDYQGTKSNYKDNLLQDRTYITGASSLKWILAPERFSWDLSNVRTLQVVDSLLPDTLDNRQVISLTSTGPSIIVPFSGRNKLTGSVNYSIADYEQSVLSKQDRITTDLLFSHNFSTSYISSIGANFLQSKFDGFPLLDFNRYEYFWQNEYITEVVNLSLSLGQTTTERDSFGDQESLLIRFGGNYRVNSQSTFEFNYSDSYEDVFSDMLGLGAGVNADQVIGSRIGNSNVGNNYQLVQKSLAYIYTKSEFFNMYLRYSERERTYDTLGLAENQTDQLYDIGANWKLFENWDMGIYGRYTELDFSDINREQERNEYGFNATYRISKSLVTRFSVSAVDQSGAIAFDNYDGFNCSLSLTYVLGNK